MGVNEQSIHYHLSLQNSRTQEERWWHLLVGGVMRSASGMHNPSFFVDQEGRAISGFMDCILLLIRCFWLHSLYSRRRHYHLLSLGYTPFALSKNVFRWQMARLYSDEWNDGWQKWRRHLAAWLFLDAGILWAREGMHLQWRFTGRGEAHGFDSTLSQW